MIYKYLLNLSLKLHIPTVLWCGNPVFIQLGMQQEQRGEAEEREPVWYFQQYAKIYLQLHTHTPYEEVEEEKEKEKKNSKFQQ
jgi:hypothetical protein